MTVAIDLDAGRVTIAGTVLDGVSDASGVALGALTVRGGAVIAPISYGQRAELCALHRTGDALAAATLAAATLAGRPEDDAVALEALALHLAGARASTDRPGFAEVAVTMQRVFGWDVVGLLAAPAHLVDELAATAAGPGDDNPVGRHDDGWVSFELRHDLDDDRSSRADGGDDGQAVGDVLAFRAALADDLIRRGAMSPAGVSGSRLPDAPRGADALVGGGTAESGAAPVSGGSIAGSHAGDRRHSVHPGETTDRTGSGPTAGAFMSSAALEARGRAAGDPGVADPGVPGITDSDPTVPARTTADRDELEGRRPTDRGRASVPTSSGGGRASAPWHVDGPEVAPDAHPSAAGQPRGGPAAHRAVEHDATSPPERVPVPTAAPPSPPSAPMAPSSGERARRGGGRGLADALDRHHVPRPAIGPEAGTEVVFHSDVDEVADELAAALDRESDIRGLLPW